MSEHRALLRPEIDHPDIVVRVDDALDPLAAWLPAYFCDAVRNGSRFAPDQTVQIGCSIIKLMSLASGDLLVTEPDFLSIPIKWNECANRSVRSVYVQRAVCDEMDVEPDFPSILQPASVPLSLPRSDKFVMTRVESSGRQSGWIIRRDNHDDVQGRLASLYEVAISNPAIVPFLALPPGSIVTRDATQLTVRLGERRATSTSGGLLARLAEAGV